jgi:hypothetical protein
MKSAYFSKDDTYQFTEELEEPENTEIILGLLENQVTDQEKSDPSTKLKRPKEPQAIWSNRVKPVNSDPSDDQTIGVLMHQLAANARSLKEAQFTLERMRSRFTIDANTYESLSQLISALYTDQRFVELIENGNVFAERGILINGETKRPDMVVERDSETFILDFKTGIEDKSHQKQIAAYMAGLSHISSNKVSGFLLYVDKSVNWVEVKNTNATAQASLFD